MPGPTDFALSADVFKYWIIDRVERKIRVILQDGREFTEDLAIEDDAPTSQIAVSIFDWEKWWITTVTKRDHILFAEGYSPYTKDAIRGRPVVYLDQNHWSTVAQATLRPELVKSETEFEAALEIVRLASDAGIVLPLSAGHLRETSALCGLRRYEVGVVMASLSGGWQMRHPMTVWHNEVALMLGELLDAAAPPHCSLPVNTLEPNAFLADAQRPYDVNPNSAELLMLAIISPAVIVEVLLDPERDEPVSSNFWVELNQRISREVGGMKVDKGQRRLEALCRFWQNDLGTAHKAMRSLGLDPSNLPDFSGAELVKLLSQHQMLMHLSGLFVQRYVNAEAKWKPGDLTDLMFLSCAAGYADYVVAETYTGTQLRQIQKSKGDRINVHLTLSEVVEALHADGVQTDSERRATTEPPTE
jgi:hypothetical protein